MVLFKSKRGCCKSTKKCDKCKRPPTPPPKRVSFCCSTNTSTVCCEKPQSSCECKPPSCTDACLKPGCSVRMPCLSCTRRGVKALMPCRVKTACEKTCCQRRYCYCSRKPCNSGSSGCKEPCQAEMDCGDTTNLRASCKQPQPQCVPVEVCVTDNCACPAAPCEQQKATDCQSTDCQSTDCQSTDCSGQSSTACPPQRKLSKCCCELCKQCEAMSKCRPGRCRAKCVDKCADKRAGSCGRALKRRPCDCGCQEVEVSCEEKQPPCHLIPLSCLRSVGSFVGPTISSSPQCCSRSSALMFQQAYQSPTCTLQYLP